MAEGHSLRTGEAHGFDIESTDVVGDAVQLHARIVASTFARRGMVPLDWAEELFGELPAPEQCRDDIDVRELVLGELLAVLLAGSETLHEQLDVLLADELRHQRDAGIEHEADDECLAGETGRGLLSELGRQAGAKDRLAPDLARDSFVKDDGGVAAEEETHRERAETLDTEDDARAIKTGAGLTLRECGGVGKPEQSRAERGIGSDDGGVVAHLRVGVLNEFEHTHGDLGLRSQPDSLETPMERLVQCDHFGRGEFTAVLHPEQPR